MVTTRFMEIVDVANGLIDECGELAMARHPGLQGTLALDVSLATDPEQGNLIASADLDEKATSIADRELIECATENVFAAEEVLAKLREQRDATGGNIVLRIEKTYPPPPPAPPDWPADDSSPSCPEGTRLAGAKPAKGTSQWCELPDQTRHGEMYLWEDGQLAAIMTYDHGTSNSMRMRPRNLPTRRSR